MDMTSINTRMYVIHFPIFLRTYHLKIHVGYIACLLYTSDIVVLNESIDLADHIVKLIVQHAKLIMPLCIIIGGRWSMVLAGIPLIIIDFLYQRADVYKRQQ